MVYKNVNHYKLNSLVGTVARRCIVNTLNISYEEFYNNFSVLDKNTLVDKEGNKYKFEFKRKV